MVSILSFFTKKRPKTTPEPAARPSTPPSPRASTSSRIARTKSNRVPTPPQVKKDRRASLDGYGLARRKAAATTGAALAPVTAAPPRITIDLPFEVTPGGSAPAAGKRAARASLPAAYSVSLGLDAVGGTPTISAAERRVLDAQRYSAADVRKAWEWLGPEVKERGAETVGIMLPRRFEANKDKQRQLAVLFVLARRPELADKFPTITSTYSTPKKDDAAEVWKSRLIVVAKDTENPVNIAEALKSLLRRLAGSNRPVVDPSVYVRFVQQEHAASYPRNAYATMLLPHLSDDVMGLLDTVFEVCNAIAMHAETNAMGAGRLCHLIGWWLLGKIPDGTTGWNALYDEYKLAGQRAEHLFYARIRWQSTQQKMPRRLVQLILSYPFGESSASFEHLPLPPTSTFTRRVLHVALGTDASLPSGTDPVKVLGDAIIARLDDKVSADEWKVLRNRDGRPVTLDELLARDSLAFLDEVCAAKGMELTSPPMFAADLPDEDSRYHPFADDEDRVVTSNFSQYRRRSSSYGDIPHLEIGSSGSSTLETVTEDGSPQKQPGLVRFGSARQLSPTKKSTPVWDDFLTSGFGDSLSASDISLALTKPAASSRDGGSSYSPPKKIIVKGASPSTSLLVSGQDVIDVDDAFIQFVEDGQLDPVASTSWPRFALVELSAPVLISKVENITWLLVSVKKREVKRRISEDDQLPDIRAELTRSMSPSNESSISRLSTFGFRDIANTFRRSSTYGGSRSSHRMSFIHTSSAKTSAKGGESLSPVQERGGRMSAASDAPTEYTIGEVGDMVKIPSALELSQIAAGTPRAGSPVPAEALEAAKPIVASTSADWAYLAEGGAHVVFRYIGSEPTLQGRALRLQKVAKKGSPDVAVRHAWSDKLLPMIMPAHLIPETVPITLEEKWTRALVAPTEGVRQSSRRAEGPLSQVVDYSRPAQLIDNLTAPSPTHKVLALEIKPKWGFLPSASNLTPHESILIKTRNCRFCLHQHYRGEYTEDGYCPIDLYSGDEKRVRRALDSLWKTWRESGGEKNNLRIFVDGSKVLPKDAHLIPTSGPNLPEGSYALVEPLLSSSNVLATLKKLQSNLDPHDISSLAQDFAVAHPNDQLFSAELVPEPTIPELTEFVLMYKRGETNWTLRQREIAYGLSAIFKDCSIIIRAVLRSTAQGYELDNDNSTVKLIDTDLKPLASLGHWAELDDKLWRNWSATKGETVVVIESSKAKNLSIKPTAPEDAPATPDAPHTPMSAIGDTVYAATALGAGPGATLAVPTPKTSPSRRTTREAELSASPRTIASGSIPDMEDANSALARVVTDEEDEEETQPPVVAKEEAQPPVVAKEEMETLAESPVEAAAVAVEAAPVEAPVEVAPEVAAIAPSNAAEESVSAPVLAAGAAAVAAAAAAAVTLSKDAEPAESEQAEAVKDVTEEAAPVEAVVAEAAPSVETPVETAAETAAETVIPESTPEAEAPVEAPAASVVPEATAAETSETAPETSPQTLADIPPSAFTNKPAMLDLTHVDDVPTPLVSPVAVTDPTAGLDVDFTNDPFAKAPVVLPRMESRTSLAASATASAAASAVVLPRMESKSSLAAPSAAASAVALSAATPPTSPPAAPAVIAPSGISSDIATPVAALPSRPSTPAGTTPSLIPTPVERTQSRVRDRIKAIEGTDKDHKPVVPGKSIGLGVPGGADKAKRPVKKGSFAAFVRKASSTFDKEKKDEKKDKSPASAPAALAPASPAQPASPPKKERAVNPFGSLRNKKKMAAAAGAAAIAATATVAGVSFAKDEKAEVETPVETPVEKAEAAEAPVEAPIETPVEAAVESAVLETPVVEAQAPVDAPEVQAELPVVALAPEAEAEVSAPAEIAPAEVEVPATAVEAETEAEVAAPAVIPVETAAEIHTPDAVPVLTEEIPAPEVDLPAAVETEAPVVEAEVAAPVEVEAPVEVAPAEVTPVEVAPVEIEVPTAVETAPEVAPVEIELATPTEVATAPAEIELATPTEVAAPVEVPIPSEEPVVLAPEVEAEPVAEAAETATEAAIETPVVVETVATVEASDAHVVDTAVTERELAPVVDTEAAPITTEEFAIPERIEVEAVTDELIPAASTVEATAAEPAVAPEEPTEEQPVPESAVLPKEHTPEIAHTATLPIAAASAAIVGLGFGLAGDSEPAESAAPAESPLEPAAHTPIPPSADMPIPPSVDIAPPTPLTETPEVQPEYFSNRDSVTLPDPKTAGYSAVTPEFASTGVFASPLGVATELPEVPEAEEKEPTPVASMLSAEYAVTPTTEVIDLSEPEIKPISRAASPVPGPPENVEMYQHAELPPLPVAAATAALVSSAPMAVLASADSRNAVASQSSAEVDPTTFATAPDTPLFATAPGTPVLSDDSNRLDDGNTVNLPELAAFTRKMAERRLVGSDSATDLSEDKPDKRMSAQTFGGKDNYRSSVHTFGGTTSEAAWLNGLGNKAYEKSRLSMDSMTVPEIMSSPKLGTSSTLGGLAAIHDEKEKDTEAEATETI